MSRKFVALVALATLSATSAMAATPLTATLAVPATVAKPVLASVIWHCEATTCTSASTVNVSDATACRAVAKSLGQVTAFTSARGAFDETKLGKCNGAVTAAK
jgi:hypothetical protein